MLRWLNKRSVVHIVIVVLFAVPVLALILPYDLNNKYSAYRYSPFLVWINRELGKWELDSIDARIRFGTRAPVSPEIVFLALDSASTSTALDSELDASEIAASRPLTLMHAGFPYSREVWALVCEKLFAAGARVVAIDIWFPGPTPNDDAWKSAIDQYRDKLVIAMNFTVDPMNGAAPSLNTPSTTLFPEQNPMDDALGYVNYWPDSDDIVRDAQYRNNIDHVNENPGAEKFPKLYSFAARAVQKGGHADLIPDDLNSRTMRLAGPPLRSFHNHSLYQIFDDHAWKDTFHNGEDFRDKIVVIGPQGDMFKDKSNTPYGLMDGAELHLNAINCLIQNQFLAQASTTLTFSMVVVFALIALALGLMILGIGWRFLAALGVVGGYTMALVWSYNGSGLLLPAFAPLGVFCGATGTGFIYDFVLTQIEKLRLRTTFERYNSKNVVKYLLENTESYKEMLVGTRRPVTVLFSDIRKFTTIVETTPDSAELVKKLNEYFTSMVDCVFRFDGTLDKFMGDGIMAIWGNTPYNFGPDGDAVRAVRSALAMTVELRKLNAKWLSEGKTEWQFGIGLNHGQVIVGDMGSQQHKEFGVVGDAINLGSRLEGLTKLYKLQIILGESVAELVRDKFQLRSVDIVQVSGKSMAVRAYTVLGEKSDELPPEQKKFLSLYEEGISSFRRREFDRAKELFDQSLAINPKDYLAAQYIKSCSTYIENPPDASWTGIRVMTEK